MMQAVRASSRISIAWPNSSDPSPYEDTDTLVLTIKSLSLDLRVVASGPYSGMVEWSTVCRVDSMPGSTAEKPVLKWTPLIEHKLHLSSNNDATSAEDVGSFTVLTNGDVQEECVLFNAKSGRLEPCVETWRRFPSSSGDPYLVLRRKDLDTEAYLGRIGSRALGLARDGKTWRAWRDEMKDGFWVRAFEKNVGDDGTLPSLPEAIPETWKEGEEALLAGRAWQVISIGTL